MCAQVYSNKLTPESFARSEATISKRLAIKVWFHQTLFKEEYDDHFKNEECISIYDADNLSLVPSCPRNLSSSFPSITKKNPPQTVDADSTKRRQNEYKRHKLRDFKNRLTSKFRGLKRSNSEKRDKSFGSENDCVVQSIEEEENIIKCFSALSDNLETLFQEELVREFDSDCLKMHKQKSISQEKDNSLIKTQRDQSSAADQEYENGQASHQEGYDTVIKHPLGEPVGSIKRNSSDNMFENSIRKRLCAENTEKNTVNLVKEKMESPGIVSDMETVTPHVIQTSSKSMENVVATEAGDKPTSSDGTIISDKSDNEADNHYGISHSSSELSRQKESSLNANSSESVVKMVTIPTFRFKNSSNNITAMVKEIEEKDLSNNQLNNLAKTGSTCGERITFQDKRFYDDIPTDFDEDAIETEFTIKSIEPVKEEHTPSHVSFDKYSVLVVYEPSEKCQASKDSIRFLSENVVEKPQSLRVEHTKPESSTDNVTKSILKTRPNSKEQEESRRAFDCDRVDVNSFLDYFERIESKRQSENSSLGKFREKQLTCYYSGVYFPELLQTWKSNESVGTEYMRSKRATEINIGRKFGEQVCCAVAHAVNV